MYIGFIGNKSILKVQIIIFEVTSNKAKNHLHIMYIYTNFANN